jgi:hypothetical protein
MSGFEAPNYTMVPNDFFDLVAEMDVSEIRVLIYLMRETFGWHRPTVQMSIRQLARAAKLSPKSVQFAAVRLEERGLISRSVLESNTTVWECLVSSNTPLREKIFKSVLPVTAKNSHIERNKYPTYVDKESKRRASALAKLTKFMEGRK